MEVAEIERWLASILNYIPGQSGKPTATPVPAPANDATADVANHPPGCQCAVHLQLRKTRAQAG
jgi:5-methyltetrahydrofolate--homocysteine methyltransferase